MAKSQQVSSILVPVALIAWREVNNFRGQDNYGEANEIRNSLATYGWNPDNPIAVGGVGTDRISEADQTAELEKRETEWAALKAATTPEAAVELKVFEMLYVKDGKLIKPEYSANAGFRRGRTYFGAMVQRFREAASGRAGTENMTINGLIPVRPTVYDTKADLIYDQQLENEMQGKGTVRMSDKDKLRVSKALFDEGCREVDIRKLYSSSIGQKTYGICRANENWAELNIYKRLVEYKSEHPDFLKLGPQRGPVLVKLNNRFEAQRKIKENLPLKPDERGLPPIDAKEVDDALRAASNAEGNDTKMMSKTDITDAAKGNKVHLFRSVFDSVEGNTQANLQRYLPYAEGLNIVKELMDGNKVSGEQLADLMTAVKEAAAFMELASKIVKAGLTEPATKALDYVISPPVKVEVTKVETNVPVKALEAPKVMNQGKREAIKS